MVEAVSKVFTNPKYKKKEDKHITKKKKESSFQEVLDKELNKLNNK